MAARLLPGATVTIPSDVRVPSSKRRLIESRVQLDALPRPYHCNSIKDQSLIQFAEDFRRQFARLYPHRRPLLLSPFNECGVRKFICTSIRPTSLPFHSEYDLAQCADFVADFLTYLRLDDSHSLPDYLPSATSLIAVRSGDCLDQSVFLCSLLRGCGYDAYVVTGLAPQSIADNDVSRVRCPLLPDAEAEATRAETERQRRHAEEIKRNRYLALIEIPIKPQSKFDADKLIERREKSQSVAEEWMSSEQPQPMKKIVPHAHCWVMVCKGRRDVTDDLFIESSTGAVYGIASDSNPYVSVDAVFNECNYWVNTQPLTGPINTLRIELGNDRDWEAVLPSMPSLAAIGYVSECKEEEKEQLTEGGDSDGGSGSSDSTSANSDSATRTTASNSTKASPRQWLDIPASWVAPIEISRDLWQARYPLGSKSIQFDHCLLEKYSPYTEKVKGLTQRLTVFDSNEDTCSGSEVVAIHEHYQHRADKLSKKLIEPKDNKVSSFYLPGLASGLHSMIVIEKVSRTLTFYANSRVDGLIERKELIGVKVYERYENREDNLVYRSLSVDHSQSSALLQSALSMIATQTQRAKSFLVAINGGPELPIRKLAERFAPNDSVDPECDVVKRSHLLIDNLIKLDYACIPGALCGSTWLIDKNDKLESGEVEGRSATSRGYLRRQSRNYTEKTRGEEQKIVAKLLATEKEMKVKIKEREARFTQLIEQLYQWDERGELVVNVYDKAHRQALANTATSKDGKFNGEHMTALKTSQLDDSASGAGGSAVSQDYLSPFLTGLDLSKPLPRKQCEAVKQACLTALKERLLSRASIIQAHLEDEQVKLASKQSSLKRAAGAGSMEASEEFQAFSSQCLFRIDILLARRARHEAMAIKKFAALEQQLSEDPRLAALYESSHY